MAITTNNKGTVSSVLGMVSTIANTVTGTFEAIGTGTAMLNKYASEAAADQSDAAKVHRQVYRSNLVTNSALEQNKLQLEVAAHLAANPSEAASFQAVHAQLSALFAEA